MPDLSDDQLETELHLLAVLLERHKNLVTVMTDGGDVPIGEIQDHSPELHKGIVVFLQG